MYLEWIKTAFTHFSPLSLSIVLTQLNRWCANLFDMIVCNGHISSFMINPNGLYPHVPSHATEFELALALIFKTGSTLLVHHWQPGGLELDNHCAYDRHCQYKSPFVCCSVCLSCWLAARGGTEHADMLEQYYGANYITIVCKHTVKLLYTINNHTVSGESIIDFTLSATIN